MSLVTFEWFHHKAQIKPLDHLNQELPTLKDRADFTIEIDYFV